jgi:opacity protein-like surface antigen
MESRRKSRHRMYMPIALCALLVLSAGLIPRVTDAADRIVAPAKSLAQQTAGQKPLAERRNATVTPMPLESQQTQTLEADQPAPEPTRFRERAPIYNEPPANQPVYRMHDRTAESPRRREVPADPGKGNEVFFRGGYVGMMSDRRGEIFTDQQTFNNPADKGYYLGAGLDLQLTCDTWGMLNGVSILGEINVEHKRFNSAETTVAVPTVVNGNTPGKVQVTMLTVSISPKIKFNGGHPFQPWIIPIGMDFLVVSPPSNQTQYLDVGAQFGVGAEYQVWKEFKVGMDFRYHLSANQTQTVNSYWTAGPYVGIGF